LLDAIGAVKKRNGESKLAEILKLLDDDARKIFDEKIFATSWYPLEAFTSFLDADVRATANGNESVLVHRAEVLIEEQLRGIYRVFARLSSTEFFVDRLVAVHKTYFQNVDIEPRRVEPHHMTIRYVGFEPEHRLLEFIIVGFYNKALQLCGVKHPQAVFTKASRHKAGYWELDVTWNLTANTPSHRVGGIKEGQSKRPTVR